MAKYAELAKQIFQTSSGTVSVLLGEQEVMWGTSVSVDALAYFYLCAET